MLMDLQPAAERQLELGLQDNEPARDREQRRRNRQRVELATVNRPSPGQSGADDRQSLAQA